MTKPDTEAMLFLPQKPIQVYLDRLNTPHLVFTHTALSPPISDML